MEVIHDILLIYPAFLWGCIVTLAGAQTMLVPNYTNSVLQGEEVTLKCYFPDPLSLRNCQWYFTQDEGVEKNLTNGTRYTMSCSFKDENFVHIQISFKNATFTDTGKYTCETITATGKVRGELLLNVYAKPEITVPKSNYTAVSGTNVTLECVVNPTGEINIYTGWHYRFRQQWNNVTQSNKYFWTTQMPSLIISEVTTTDSGVYRCFAFNHLITVAGSQIFLQVWDLPQVTVPQTQLFITSGEDLVLNCSVNGKGMSVINVQWYRQYQALPNNTKYIWRQSGPDASIRIIKATEDDAGIYVCEGTTDVGSSRGNNIELRVGYKPTVAVNEYNYSIGMGDNFTLHCSIDGHGSAVKGIYWLKHENSQNRYLHSSTRLFFNISNPSLKIINVSFDDAGNYTCRGETELGTTESQKISVQVFYLPVISQQDKDRTGISSMTSVICGVSIVACVTFVILIALIVVVILIRRKRLKRRKDKPDSGIRSTNEQQQPSPLENISSGNAYEHLRFHQTEDLTYAHLIRQSNTHIYANTSTGDAETSHVYMNIINTNAAVQQRSSASHPNSYIQEETESENTQRKIIEELN